MPSETSPRTITVGVGGIVARGDGLLVVRKTYGPWKGLWTIPSGYVEASESVVECLGREVLEETGVVARPEVLVAVRNMISTRANDTFLVFTMSYISGQPRPDGSEVSEAAFVPGSELAVSSDAAPFTRAIVTRPVGGSGLALHPYRPPDDRLAHEAYLLYMGPGKVQ